MDLRDLERVLSLVNKAEQRQLTHAEAALLRQSVIAESDARNKVEDQMGSTIRRLHTAWESARKRAALANHHSTAAAPEASPRDVTCMLCMSEPDMKCTDSYGRARVPHETRKALWKQSRP